MCGSPHEGNRVAEADLTLDMNAGAVNEIPRISEDLTYYICCTFKNNLTPMSSIFAVKDPPSLVLAHDFLNLSPKFICWGLFPPGLPEVTVQGKMRKIQD
ncbi:hypothetical protein E1B28_003482 [Marasmius oreades]|uniref:Uncharacterized protein n=1 Tax=Marasmius oreades TaxID=181124 RepID=A0A9P7UNG4_9AGAR|nr:uncharacterized protein E1B28_003482 [Marasmius oreades]KAG7085954.1 hypothetical protein E1B28_003482 [Marasmius oreades]